MLISTSHCPAGGGLPADISLAAANGAAAVQLIKDHIQSMPCLKPLVLVLKAFLKVSCVLCWSQAFCCQRGQSTAERMLPTC